ncbi:hypothetical protein GJ744_006668 [Endocarpon pusillum]|uniref:Uncharacterized protein n=1 Tax=Endocarpon pusillum TaxID=364733 RepID=A0A8H7ALJ7_9EURO|nr:hypothetical protein GJ744_006668 [Endocarpon pusillum]
MPRLQRELRLYWKFPHEVKATAAAIFLYLTAIISNRYLDIAYYLPSAGPAQDKRDWVVFQVLVINMPSVRTLSIQLTNDTVTAKNLDLIPVGMVVKFHVGTIRSSTYGRNGLLESAIVGPYVELYGAHQNNNGTAGNGGGQR